MLMHRVFRRLSRLTSAANLPGMTAETRVVDNRVFLLGLDGLYRETMKKHERGELLRCARAVAKALGVRPASVPIEGYYAEDKRLTEYFLLARALQEVHESSAPKVAELPEFVRLREVTSAPLYGDPKENGHLLPQGRDALTIALEATSEWTVANLVDHAYDVAHRTDDISLVGLAARARDPVVLAALRESAVLYAYVAVAASLRRTRPRYVWKVDDDLAEHARRFIEAFNELFSEMLPPPESSQAEVYWHAYEANQIVGRCVRIGSSPPPIRHYHWAIRGGRKGLSVDEFWDTDVWTTARYRNKLTRQ